MSEFEGRLGTDYTRDELTLASEWVRDLARTVKVVRLYRARNPVAVDTRGRLADSLASHLARFGAWSFRVTATEIFMLKLRDLEDEAPGFLAFIPLEFQKGYTDLVERQASALEDLRTIAMSRLVWDNVPHVKSYWVMLGEETASLGLNFGASDIDGTIGEEKIAHAALAASPLGLARERLVDLIREAGKTPVERDALYNVVRVYDEVPA